MISILHCAPGGGQLSINGLCYCFVGCTRDCSGNGLTVSNMDAQTSWTTTIKQYWKTIFEYMEVSNN